MVGSETGNGPPILHLESPMTRIVPTKLTLLASFASVACASQQTGAIKVFNTVELDSCCNDCCEDDCCEDDCEDDSPVVAEPEPEPVTDECACPDGYEPTPDDDACVMTTEFEATFSGVEYSVCQGDTEYVYGMYGALLPGGMTIQNDFWGCLLYTSPSPRD